MFKKITALFFAFLLIVNCSSKKSIISNDLVQKNAEIELISSQFSFTEGPASDAFGNVYFTDQPNDKIYVWN